MRRARDQVESKKRDDDSLAPFLRSTTKKTGQHRQQSDKGVAQPTTWSGFVPSVKRAFVRWVRHYLRKIMVWESLLFSEPSGRWY